MPHAIYLHSGLTQARVPVRNDADRRKVLRFSNQEVVIALTVAGLVNIAMVMMASGAFHAGHPELPHGAPHTFVNAGDDWARWIGVLSPGSALGMLEALGRLIPHDGPPEEAAILQMFTRYGTTIQGPPLT